MDDQKNYEPLRLTRPTRSRRWAAWLGAFLSLAAVTAGLIYWFVIRIEIGGEELLVLVNKTGRIVPADLAPEFTDQIVLYPDLVKALAQREGESEEWVIEHYKGLQYRVYPEGRYFPNPYHYRAIRTKATVIDQNQVGVLIRKYGKPLPFPKTVATEPDERGPVSEVLRPGRYNINPLAYEVQKFPALQIPEGHVGVVTLLSGKDPHRRNTYTVEPGEKGVQRRTLPPGLEYYNPYLQRIDVVDVRSHKYDLLSEDAIQFPSNDSFTISIEGTIEWAIRPDHVAEVTVAYGDEEDILNKSILPNARSISRIQGSKLKARDFISGKTRTAFQETLLADLRDKCWAQGIDIRSALVRDIHPPEEIATPISEREQADQEIERYNNEMQEAKSQARLVEQLEMQDQNSKMGEAKRAVVTLVKAADQRKVVAVTEAHRELEVAKLRLEAAEKEADALRSRGRAEANVVLFNFKAKAEPLATAVQAFGGGETYAQRSYLEKVAPAIQTILSNTDGPFADIFRQFQQSAPAGGQGGGQ